MNIVKVGTYENMELVTWGGGSTFSHICGLKSDLCNAPNSALDRIKHDYWTYSLLFYIENIHRGIIIKYIFTGYDDDLLSSET